MSDSGQQIDVSRLRVGMYVHLDVGWTQHPFPFSSFKIKSQDQIETIRSLGLARVRYSPDKSDVPPVPASAPPAPVTAATPAPAPPKPTAGASADDRAARERREMLQVQQMSLTRCEQRFSDASRTFRQIASSARSHPEAARAATESLVQGMFTEVAGEREVAIRLLSEHVGEDTSQHALNVAVLCVLLGRVCGLGPASLRDLASAALLHDAGKAELPGRLRWSADQLSAAEHRLAQEHVQHSVDFARRLGMSTTAQTAIAEHHERADGSGYPKGLRGPQISPGGRVLALVNQYDNLCNPGNALHALTPHEALATIFTRLKAGFDPATLALFVRMMGVYPPGSVVQLNDGRFALTVAVNPHQPLKPRVVVYDSHVPVEQALVVDLETLPGLEIERALKPTQLSRSVFEYLSPRKRPSYFFEPASLGL